MKKRTKKKGFTLIELIVVIAILGILAAVLIPRFSGFSDKARSTQATMHAKQIATAADALIIEHGYTSWHDTTGGALIMTTAQIKQLAGADVTGAITLGTVDANGRFAFTYKFTPTGGKEVTVVRAETTGAFTVTIAS